MNVIFNFLPNVYMKLQVSKKQDGNSEHNRSSRTDVMNRPSSLNRFPMGFMNDPFMMFENFWPRLSMNITEWMPKMDLSETSDKIKIKMNVPNVDPKDISIEVDSDNCLTISGKTSSQSEDESETSYHLEREEGSFSRTITLPHNVDVDNIEASDKNGTMTIVIPKRPSEPKKKIPVNT